MALRRLEDLDVSRKRVMLRADLNVPMQAGVVADTARLDRLVPTVRYLLARGARLVLLSHFGRPGGRRVPALSLSPVAAALARAADLGRLPFCDDCIGPAAAAAVAGLAPGQAVLLENLRFHPGEEANDPAFADALARLGDLYVNDAFSASHRAHASIDALARRLPAAAGLLLAEEMAALEAALNDPERPLAAIAGGAKVSTKLALLGNLTSKVDKLFIGGGMANTFLFACGRPIGQSLCEAGMADTARAIMAEAAGNGCEILLPDDVAIADRLAAGVQASVVAPGAMPADQMILDIGPDSVAALTARLDVCRTLVWNGPVGAFETPPFDRGTVAVARAVARLVRAGRLRAVAGGGDTVAALRQAGVLADFSYVSTAGGAFLEWLEGKTLPGIAALSA